jgi:hypothetical protein
MVRMVRSPTIAREIGMEIPNAMVPAAASTTSISWVAYATEDMASDEKTASPTILRIA